MAYFIISLFQEFKRLLVRLDEDDETSEGELLSDQDEEDEDEEEEKNIKIENVPSISQMPKKPRYVPFNNLFKLPLVAKCLHPCWHCQMRVLPSLSLCLNSRFVSSFDVQLAFIIIDLQTRRFGF